MKLLLPLLLLVLALPGCRKKGAAGGPPSGMATQVIAVKASREPVTESLSLVGTVQANEAVEIKAQLGGIVEKIHFEEGQRVEQDQLLIEIEAAKLAASLAESEANRQLAETRFNRTRELLKTRAVSQQEADEARAALDAGAANLELMRQQLKDTKIVAPFEGVAGARLISPGQVVAAQQSLTSVVDLDPVKVELSLPERFLSQAKVGQKIALTVAAFPGEQFEGEVYFIAPQVDPVNRTGLVKATVPNADMRLKPGMFASLDLTLQIKEEALVIPEAALMVQGAGTSIFVVDEEMNAQLRQVKTGLRQQGRVEIVEGLKGDEMVVVEGWQKTRPGGKVKFAPPESAAPYLSKPAGTALR